MLSSLIWFLLPCNQLTDRTLDDFYTIAFVLKMMYAIPKPIEHHLNVQTTSILLISFMPQCYFCHPATHLPVEHSYDFSIIACLHPLYYSTTHWPAGHSDDFYIIAFIPYMSPCNPLTSLTFRQLPYYCFHPLFYFLNPATH